MSSVSATSASDTSNTSVPTTTRWERGGREAAGRNLRAGGGRWGAEGKGLPPHPLTHSGPLKIEHTETDSVDPRSNGRPPNAAAVPKSAVSAPPPTTATRGGGAGWGGSMASARSWVSCQSSRKGEPVPEPGGREGIWFYQLGALLHVPPGRRVAAPPPTGREVRRDF